MLNVSINKFKNDVHKKTLKFIAQLEQQRVAELQQELARLSKQQPYSA